VLDVMAQDVVTEDEGNFVQRCFHKFERPRQPAFCPHHRTPVMPRRSKIEDCRGLGIDLQINAEASLQ
jgi:hypothetical protein